MQKIAELFDKYNEISFSSHPVPASMCPHSSRRIQTLHPMRFSVCFCSLTNTTNSVSGELTPEQRAEFDRDVSYVFHETTPSANPITISMGTLKIQNFNLARPTVVLLHGVDKKPFLKEMVEGAYT